MFGLFRMGAALAIAVGGAASAQATANIPINAGASSTQTRHAASFVSDWGVGSDLIGWAKQGQTGGTTVTTIIAGPLLFSKAAPVSPVSTTDYLHPANIGSLTARFLRYAALMTGYSARNPGVSDTRASAAESPSLEPQNWSLLGLGLVMIGLTTRRRKHRVTA